MAIQDKNLLYLILESYMDTTLDMSYSKVEYVGLENIPKEGAIIFAPNHTNAFMDALSILKLAKRPVVFVARADIFKNKYLAKLLNFFKIMPIMRIRDGRNNLKKNDEIMRKSVDVLEAGVPFCIMAEGTHRMKHSLMPLVKGIFRIALMANDELAGKKPVYIVPVGIEYGSYTRFHSHLTLQVGKPLNVSAFVKDNEHLDIPEIIMALRDSLYNRMKELIHYVPDDENYEALLDCSYLMNSKERSWLGINENTPYKRLLANQQCIKDLESIKETKPFEYDKLVILLKEFASNRRQNLISDESLYNSETGIGLLKSICLIFVYLPYFIFSLIVSLPVILISESICQFAIEDKAFCNSFRLVFLLVLAPVVWIVWTIILAKWLPWYALLCFFIFAIPTYTFVHKYVFRFRQVVSDIKYIKNNTLQNLKKSIIESFDKLK